MVDLLFDDGGLMAALVLADLLAQLQAAVYHAQRMKEDVARLTRTRDPAILEGLLARITWTQDATVHAVDALHMLLEELEHGTGQTLLPPASIEIDPVW
jgi:hypothetical protein